MIDFGYAFGAPHVITLSRPSASEKVVSKVSEEGIHFSRTYRSLREIYPLTWETLAPDVKLFMSIAVGKEKAKLKKWYRHKSGAPCLICEGTEGGTDYIISAISTETGAVIRIELENNTDEEKTVIVEMNHINGWVISNRGWIDGVNNNILLSMNGGRADRVLCYAKGADAYLMYGMNEADMSASAVPMADEERVLSGTSQKKIAARFVLRGKSKKSGWFILPYEKYFSEIRDLEDMDADKEFAEALEEWEQVFACGAHIEIEDNMLMHCYRACLADLFVMREKIGNGSGICCGTDVYRSSNSYEPLEADILLESTGYVKEALEDYEMHFEGQDENGCWAFSGGWEHEMWGAAFNKANAVMTHYKYSGDKDYLERHYHRMLSSALFNHSARCLTKSKSVKAEQGLMPRGMGDCGMINGNDYYGVFYPHNCMSVASDGLALEAAEILGKTEDAKLLRLIYEEAKESLLTSMKENLTEKDGLKIVSSNTAASDNGSIFGCLYSFFPCGLVSADEPMISDTVQYIESCKRSEGGLHEGTGWKKDGVWVAMSLNNMSRAYLRMGKYDLARKYLYPAINHATPLVTWCEERGSEKDSVRVSGDLQHLWTPLSVCQYINDAICFEDNDTMHIMAGAFPEWLIGKTIKAMGIYTSGGKTDICLENADGVYNFTMKTEREIGKRVILHLPGSIGTTKEVEFECIGKKGIAEHIALM